MTDQLYASLFVLATAMGVMLFQLWLLGQTTKALDEIGRFVRDNEEETP